MTNHEKKAAVAQLYGIQETPLSTAQFTQDDIEKMRAMVAESDRQQGGINSFDLNNPPRVPYVYRPFPKMLYDHQNMKHLTVHDAAELKAALADGWTTESFESEAGPGHVSAADKREAQKIDKQLKKKVTA